MKLFLAVFAISYVVVCSHQIAVKSLGQKIECFRGIQPRIYEDRIKELVENLRDQLKEGMPDKGIPPLDPFVMNNWNLKVNEDFAKLDWTMDGKITGLMTWTLSKVKFSIAGFKFSFEVPIPVIEGKGTYKIDGTIAEVLPVYGAGEFDVLAENLNITGSGKIGSRGSGEDQQLFLENFDIGVSLNKFTKGRVGKSNYTTTFAYVAIGITGVSKTNSFKHCIQFAVTGLMEDDSLSFLLSQMISDSLPDLLKNFQNQINAVVSSKVTEAADSVLGNMTIQDILDMLKPKPKPDPEEYMRWIGEHCGEY